MSERTQIPRPRDALGRPPAEPVWEIDVERYQHMNGKVRYSPVRVKGGQREELSWHSGWQRNEFDIYSRKYYLTAKMARRAGMRRLRRSQKKWTRVG